MQHSSTKSLVLIGGGHANIQILKSIPTLSKATRNKLNVTLIDKYESSTYSGMIPGCISKCYKRYEACIPFQPLAKYANVKFVQDEVIDIRENDVILSNGTCVKYDCVSLDIGSTVRGMNDVEGVKEYAIPTRPINNLISSIEHAESIMTNHTHYNLVVVGAGFAGIEIALTLRNRWKHFNLTVTLLNSDTQLLSQESPSCQNFMNSILQTNSITILNSKIVSKITKSIIQFDTNEEIPYTHCIWATGASPHTTITNQLRKNNILFLDQKGWIQVKSTFQSISRANIFAAGDCATITQYPTIPKAGVYAVRSGPIVFHNIISFLFEKGDLMEYKPQADFLRLINAGDGTAIGFRFDTYFYGAWVMKLKDCIDRMFINLFLEEYFVKDENEKVGQYDTMEKEHDRIKVEDAASILNSKNVNDYHVPWKIIRDMVEDEIYANDVVRAIKLIRNE